MAQFVVDFGKNSEPAGSPTAGWMRPLFIATTSAIWSAIAGFLASTDGRRARTRQRHRPARRRPSRARAPQLTWWPSDILRLRISPASPPGARTSGLANLRAPQRIDLSRSGLDVGGRCRRSAAHRNAVHQCAAHLALASCRRICLPAPADSCVPDGRLFVYGPFMRDGAHTAPSNAAFDASLRAENPDWGVRDVTS